ncbi:MAG: transcriptional repressor [Prevotellaceae bacterium]|nr:transcriptional repressor [Prevotellaceae bacterium]
MRLLVADALLKCDCAISLTDLEKMFDKVDRITLYRTIKTFEKHKLIHSIDDGTGAVKYALCSDSCDCKPEELHIHFHCTNCKKTYCLMENTMPVINLPVRFTFQKISVVIKGLCEKCSSK